MHTTLQRGNAVFAYAMTITAAVTLAAFFTSYSLDNNRDVQIKVDKLIVKNIQEFRGKRNDIGVVHFSLKADLSDVFNWNCKQLFLYLMAEYETDANQVNQVVLWDKIIQRGEDAKLNLKKQRPKYDFFDDGASLRGKEVKLSLHWNIIPNSGYMWHVGPNGNHSFLFPQEYTARKY